MDKYSAIVFSFRYHADNAHKQSNGIDYYKRFAHCRPLDYHGDTQIYWQYYPQYFVNLHLAPYISV